MAGSSNYASPLTAESGEEALEILMDTDTPIDVLLTDVSMPGMTGIELIGRSKQDSPQLQALVISGYDEFEFVQDAIHAGANGYVLKPIRVEEVERPSSFPSARLWRKGDRLKPKRASSKRR